MKLSQDARLIRKIAKAMRASDMNSHIGHIVHNASMALELVREAEYSIMDDYYEKQQRL